VSNIIRQIKARVDFRLVGKRALRETIIKLREDLSASRDKSDRLQKLLDEAREPSGRRHEEVAEWLRSHGYKVQAPEVERRLKGV
jgi:hypothetical protein